MNRSIPDSGITTVEIYTWRFCPFCLRAKALLNEKGVQFTEYSIDGDDGARTKMSERAGGRRTVPQFLSMEKVLEVATSSTNLREITN